MMIAALCVVAYFGVGAFSFWVQCNRAAQIPPEQTQTELAEFGPPYEVNSREKAKEHAVGAFFFWPIYDLFAGMECLRGLVRYIMDRSVSRCEARRKGR